jgi:hypothetical protein
MEDFIDSLNQQMHTDYLSVNPLRHPVAKALENLSVEGMPHVLSQYSLFSKNITHFLLKALYTVSDAGWVGMQREIAQNIREELNVDNPEDHLPHYVLLKQGFREAEIEWKDVTPSVATQDFIDKILNDMDCSPDAVAREIFCLSPTSNSP